MLMTQVASLVQATLLAVLVLLGHYNGMGNTVPRVVLAVSTPSTSRPARP